MTAVDGKKESDNSKEASATTEGSAPGDPPAAPTNLSASAGGSAAINLTWSDNATDEQGFEIERKTDTEGFSQLATVGSDTTAYADTGLAASTAYTYRVSAYNAHGSSDYSDEVSATTEPAAELPTDPSERFPRPVCIGVSTGHFNITAGTIACRVKDAVGNNVYALSNNHVYADENAASIGDAVLQPGVYDGGTVANDTLGHLHDFEPVYMYPLGLNTMDAAIAVTTTDDLGQSTLPAGYGTPANAVAAPALQMAVQKYGRTTRLTHGTITGLNAFILVQYSSGLAIFTGQIMIEGTGESFSAPGDSGSLVVTDDVNNNPVGLLFAGSSSVTYANPISPILSRFQVVIDGK